MKRSRAVSWASILVAAAVTLALTGVPQASAAPKVNGTLTLKPAVGAPGTAIKLTGEIAPKVTHQVKLQRRDHGTFVTLATKKTDKKGQFTFKTILPEGRWTAAYRVLSPTMRDPGTGTRMSYVTPARTAAIGTTSHVTGGNNDSVNPAISADGRFITFESAASDLVPGDTNALSDVFLWDRATGTTTRITIGNSMSVKPAISADGRYIAYWSKPSGPVPDTNAMRGVFVWDRTTGSATRISDGYSVRGDPAISADGRFITWASGSADVFVWERSTGTITRVTDNQVSGFPAISADGHYIAFESRASDLAAGDTNGENDVFVWNRSTGATTRITHGNRESVNPAISGDGRRVTYRRHDDVFVWDRSSGSTIRIHNANLQSGNPAISADGRFVTYWARGSEPDPVHGWRYWADVYVWDQTTGTTTRITDHGFSRFPAISADGRHIAYDSHLGKFNVLVCDRSN